MAMTAYPGVMATVTAQPNAQGYLTVTSNAGFVKGAYAYINSPGQTPLRVKIIDVSVATTIGVRAAYEKVPGITADQTPSRLFPGPNYGFTSLVGYGGPTTTTTVNAPSTATTGGTLAAATYFYKVTALNAAGESIASNEVSQVTTGTTSTVTLTWSAVTGATGYKVYRGTATNSENVFYSPGNVTSFTDTGAANTGGTPPGSSTAFASTITQPPQGVFNDGSPEPILLSGFGF